MAGIHRKTKQPNEADKVIGRLQNERRRNSLYYLVAGIAVIALTLLVSQSLAKAASQMRVTYRVGITPTFSTPEGVMPIAYMVDLSDGRSVVCRQDQPESVTYTCEELGSDNRG